MAADQHAELYGKFRAAILARHFALRPNFRTNLFGDGHVLDIDSDPAAHRNADWLAHLPDAEQLIHRWSIRDNPMGASNPLLFGGQLMTCLAVEHLLGRHDALTIIKLLLKTLASLYKFDGRGDNFDGYIIRYDAVTNGAWKLDAQGKPLYSLAFPIGQGGRYDYCPPLNDPRYMRPYPGKYDGRTYHGDEYDPDERTTFKWLCRAAEVSQDELTGLITGYFMVHHLVEDAPVRAEVARQAGNLGRYLAAHGYVLVRPAGGMSGHAVPLEFAAQRAFQRITGTADPAAFGAAVDFVGALKIADVWKCVEARFNLGAVGGIVADLPVALLTMLLGMAAEPLIRGPSAAQFKQFADQFILALGGNLLAPIHYGRAVALAASPGCFDVWRRGYADEFAVAYLLSLIRPSGWRHAVWLQGMNIGIGGLGSAVSFPPYLALTSLDDVRNSLWDARQLYLDWFAERQSSGRDAAISDGSNSLFAGAVAVVLGAGPGEERRLAARLQQTQADFHGPVKSIKRNALDPRDPGWWIGQDRLPLTSRGDNFIETTEATLWPMDYMTAVALAWLHARRRAGQPITAPGFPTLPDPALWPDPAVPNNVIAAARAGWPKLPLDAIQAGALVQDGDGAKLFGDPPVPRSPEPPPILPPPPTEVRFDGWVTVPEKEREVDTGIRIRDGDIFSIEQATGQIWSGVWIPNTTNGPKGWDNVEHDPKFPYHGFSGPLPCRALGATAPSHPFALIGKLTNYFFIGDRLPPVRYFADPEINAGDELEPRLVLRTNDDTPGNGNGAFQCRVRVLGTPKPARFVSSTMPTSLRIGQMLEVTIRMHNPGPVKWLHEGKFPYRLGSQRPQDNGVWGTGRVALPWHVWPGQDAVFTFPVTAPAIPGNHDFCWRMVQEGVEWFGDFTPNVVVSVSGLPMVVTAAPYPVPVNRSVQAIVRAADAAGAPLAGTVTITRIDGGTDQVPANQWFPYTFRTRTVARRTSYPMAQVTVPGGYLVTGVDFGWPPSA